MAKQSRESLYIRPSSSSSSNTRDTRVRRTCSGMCGVSRADCDVSNASDYRVLPRVAPLHISRACDSRTRQARVWHVPATFAAVEQLRRASQRTATTTAARDGGRRRRARESQAGDEPTGRTRVRPTTLSRHQICGIDALAILTFHSAVPFRRWSSNAAGTPGIGIKWRRARGPSPPRHLGTEPSRAIRASDTCVLALA